MRKLLNLLLASLFVWPSISQAQSEGQVPDAVEHAALVALYNSTNGDGWNKNDNWLQGTNFATWYGVTVRNGDITGLALNHNQLTGEIPEELGNLTNLTSLLLHYNRLEGTIPASFGQLTKVTKLQLVVNQLTGPLPDALGSMSSLTELGLSANPIASSIPAAFGQLSELRSLRLDGCQLTGSIPKELGQLTKLTTLVLNQNQLTGEIPEELGNLTNLTSLQLQYNQLEGTIPASFGQLTKVIQLQLVVNQLSGPLPDALGSMSSLRELSLAANPIASSIPAAFGQLSELRSLRLDGCQLTGSIPKELGQLTKLTTLILNHNKLTGEIPEALGQLTNLTTLSLHQNQLTGEIPEELGNLTNLTSLQLHYNQLEGTIPASFGQLTKVTQLQLVVNQLTGPLPDALGSMSSLRELSLAANPIASSIPAAFGQLSELRSLRLDGCQLTGSIPKELGQLTNLTILTLNRNQLTGEIPEELGNLTNLTSLIMDQNKLQGAIPASFGQLTKLTRLDLFVNRLSGIPNFRTAHPDPDKLQLRVYSNRISLNDIAQNLTGPDTHGFSLFKYSNQGSDQDTITVVPVLGETLTLEGFSETPPHPRTNYQWQQQVSGEWGDIESANTSSLTLASVTLADTGFYRFRITNDWLEGMVQQGPSYHLVLDKQPAAWLEAECATVGSNWNVAEDASAAGGKYLTYPSGTSMDSAPTNPADHVAFSVDVAESGSYHLQARIRAPNLSSNSLWFKVDNGNWIKWWEGIATGSVFNWNLAPGAPFTLNPGTHTITVAYRESGTQLDKISLSTNPALPDGLGDADSNCTLGSETYWVEAECADIGADWQIGNSASAAGGNYLSAPGKNSRNNPPTGAAAHLVLNLEVAEAGSYYLLARVQAPSDGGNSLWFRIDSGDWIEWWEGMVIGNTFAWNLAPSGPSALSAGSHTITIAYREGDTRLDKIALSPSDDLPDGLGETVDCGGTSDPSALVWTEAECATVGANWAIQESSSASGGKYLVYPAGGRASSPPVAAADQLKLVVEVTEAGPYYLLGRINAPSLASNSFWIRIDDQPWIEWWEGIATGSGFNWNVAPGGPTDLSAGSHTITVAYREAGTQLDKLLLSTSDQAPEGVGEPVTCDTPPDDYEEVPGEPLAFRPQWGGNVAAMVWSTFHYELPVYQQAYTYDYSQASRLTEARYASQDTDGGWTANQSNYSVHDIGYDANGNITGLTRYTADPVNGTPVRRLMDQLSYTYAGNRVRTVSDAADAELGFADGASNGNEYGYDANGNLTRDDNKGITNIAYDPVLDVPLRVDFADGARIDYLYDAAGNRLAQTITAVDGTSRTTDYVGAVEYRNDQLALIHQPEGRVIKKSSGEFVYHYDLRDHLGNVRLTFSEEPMVASSDLTMETPAAPTEEALFEHVAAARQTLAYHNTTDASREEPQPNKVARLQAGQTGPAKSLSVRAGDQVHLQVNAAYETGRGKVQGLEGIATQVAGAASRSAAGLESGGAIAGSNGLAAGSALTTGKQQAVPPAYLNYLVYDTDFQLVDQGFVQVSEAAAVEVGSTNNDPAETLTLDVDIAQNGYLYAYLSHDVESSSPSATAVYFDDFTVEHEGISIVQHNDYYAFGAVYQQSADRVLNNAYLYQGKELQDGLGLDLYDFHARQYDPLLGRMTSVDPMAASWDGMSPYVGMANNPVSYVDPDGRNPILIGMMIGGTAGFGIGYASGLRGNELVASTLGGMALGAGIGFGIDGGFAGFGQSVGNVAGQGLNGSIDLAQRVFQGAELVGGSGKGLFTAGFEVGKVFGQEVVNNYGLGRADYGLSYQPSRYAGMNTMQYHQARTSDAFFEHPVTQGAIDILTTPLPVPKLGMTRIIGRIGGRAIFEGASNRILNTTLRQLQAKFKHASDFGVTGNWNKAAAGRFSSAINQHINSSGVKAINGTYHGQPAIHYLNPETGINVISRPNGQFWSGWKLNPEQLRNVLEHGGL